jgi:hypothetical protein
MLTRHSLLGSLGAFLMLISVITSPVTQLVIEYPTPTAQVDGIARAARSSGLVGNGNAKINSSKARPSY